MLHMLRFHSLYIVTFPVYEDIHSTEEDTKKAIFKQSNTFFLLLPVLLEYFIHHATSGTKRHEKTNKCGVKNLIIYTWHKEEFAKKILQECLVVSI